VATKHIFLLVLRLLPGNDESPILNSHPTDHRRYITLKPGNVIK